MSTFSSKPFVDLNLFMYLKFSIVKIRKYYNLDLIYISETGEESLKQRTSVYSRDIPEMAEKLQTLLSSNAFDHLVFITQSECVDENGEIEFEFNFDDYIDIGDYEDGLQCPSTSTS